MARVVFGPEEKRLADLHDGENLLTDGKGQQQLGRVFCCSQEKLYVLVPDPGQQLAVARERNQAMRVIASGTPFLLQDGSSWCVQGMVYALQVRGGSPREAGAATAPATAAAVAAAAAAEEEEGSGSETDASVDLAPSAALSSDAAPGNGVIGHPPPAAAVATTAAAAAAAASVSDDDGSDTDDGGADGGATQALCAMPAASSQMFMQPPAAVTAAANASAAAAKPAASAAAMPEHTEMLPPASHVSMPAPEVAEQGAEEREGVEMEAGAGAEAEGAEKEEEGERDEAGEMEVLEALEATTTREKRRGVSIRRCISRSKRLSISLSYKS